MRWLPRPDSLTALGAAAIVVATAAGCTGALPSPHALGSSARAMPGSTLAFHLPRAVPRPRESARREGLASADSIRVVLEHEASPPRVTSRTGFVVLDRAGTMLGQSVDASVFRFEADGRRLRAAIEGGGISRWADGPLVVRPLGPEPLAIDGKRYRGELRLHAADSGLLVVNALELDEYLLGVVPLEMGRREALDSAALEAQAIASRSYAAVRRNASRGSDFDLGGTVMDQVYGGVGAENDMATRAVERTRSLVLWYGGRVVSAPYSSACGGRTADAGEVWRGNVDPHLRSVSDAIPGTTRYWCDIAPRHRWTRTYAPGELDQVLSRYLARYVSVPSRGAGQVRQLSVTARTPTGRVKSLEIATDRSRFTLTGNDIRFVLRSVGGEMLNSTYFSVEAAAGAGDVGTLTLRGQGYGHGIGMCQWGAIGRARAGHDARTILAAYYPGTSVAPLR